MATAMIAHCSATISCGRPSAPALLSCPKGAAGYRRNVRRQSRMLPERASVISSAAAPASGAMAQNVEDIMTSSSMLTCTPETSIDDALELLVEHHVTGLPVVDTDNVVVGVVSDFDLLALEGVTTADKAKGFFPEAGTDWNSFYEVQKLVAKNAGTCVGDVMTSDPVCVRPTTSIEDAANLLLRKKIRRLPVVDERCRLLGIITRSNIIKAAWEARKAAQGNALLK